LEDPKLGELQMPAFSAPIRSWFEPIPWRKQWPPADQPVSWWLGWKSSRSPSSFFADVESFASSTVIYL